jgi:hypothetical protein
MLVKVTSAATAVLDELDEGTRIACERDIEACKKRDENGDVNYLRTGKCLLSLRQRLEPYGLWLKLLQSDALPFAQKTVYRYMNGYENVSRWHPALVKEAIERNMCIWADAGRPFGSYTTAIASLPPPRNPSAQAAKEWLNTIETQRRRQRYARLPEIKEPDDLLHECVRFIDNRTERLPKKHRRLFGRKLTGMLRVYFDLSGEPVSAVTIPDDWLGPGMSEQARANISASQKERWDRLRRRAASKV